MTVIPPRYEARQNAAKGMFGVWDTFRQEWAWRASNIARFDNLEDEAVAVAQSDALNRIYERAL